MSLNQIGLCFSYLSAVSVLIPIGSYIKRKVNFQNKTLNIIGCFLILGAITDVVSILLGLLWNATNVPLVNIEFVLEFIIISWLFCILCPWLKKPIVVIVPLFIVFFVCTCLYWQNIKTFQSITHQVAALIILFYTARYYYYLLRHLPKIPIYYFYPFWILQAFYMYFSLNLFIYAFSSFVFENMPKDTAILFWMAHGIAEIIRNVLLTVTFYFAASNKSDIVEKYVNRKLAS